MSTRRGRQSTCRLARVLTGILALSVITACQASKPKGAPVKIGLIAPLSGPIAASGQAIQRGMLLAMDEINRDGGLLGRPLALVTRDIQNDPPAGVAALRELVQTHSIVGVFGGIFSPVMLGQLDAIHELQIPLINPWGSVGAITKNGRQPNFAFRVSLSDEDANEFLVRYASEIVGIRRLAIIADTTAWGDFNVAGLKTWIVRLGAKLAGIERFDQGDTNMSKQLKLLQVGDSHGLLMVANAPEGAAIVRGMATLGWKVPIISHWGVSGGRFVELAGVDNAEGVFTIQTYSFFGSLSAKGERVLHAYHARFKTRRVEEVAAPVGVAHGYDGTQLLALAIRKAGSTDGPKVREALERLDPYDGVVKLYAPAFTPERHDALLAKDYLMAVWKSGQLVPAEKPRLKEKT
ncbi:MAG: ABC transporter substrate-binding protein [Deltaproteobacteria bacterium]|nr:ABC transporter substrate-binding protein [Deltaproteobacteria bacterium]